MFSRLQQEGRGLVKEVVQLVYFMRGAVSYEEMMYRTPAERQEMADFITERLDQESKNPYPNY